MRFNIKDAIFESPNPAPKQEDVHVRVNTLDSKSIANHAGAIADAVSSALSGPVSTEAVEHLKAKCVTPELARFLETVEGLKKYIPDEKARYAAAMDTLKLSSTQILAEVQEGLTKLDAAASGFEQAAKAREQELDDKEAGTAQIKSQIQKLQQSLDALTKEHNDGLQDLSQKRFQFSSIKSIVASHFKSIQVALGENK